MNDAPLSSANVADFRGHIHDTLADATDEGNSSEDRASDVSRVKCQWNGVYEDGGTRIIVVSRISRQGLLVSCYLVRVRTGPVAWIGGQLSGVADSTNPLRGSAARGGLHPSRISQLQFPISYFLSSIAQRPPPQFAILPETR